MGTFTRLSEQSSTWSKEALAMAAQAKVLSGNKLEQLVVRLQRHSGRTKEACWRFIIQHGLKGKVDHRRWTEAELETVREELIKRSVEEVAKKLNRTPKAIRNILRRNNLSVREIRCDLFSVDSLASALHVRKSEIVYWIEQNWLEALVESRGKRRAYIISPDAFTKLYKNHQRDLLKRGLRNQSLFEAYVQYCFSPKHTVGEQLLDVRRDKREREAFAELDQETSNDEQKEEAYHAFAERDFDFETTDPNEPVRRLRKRHRMTSALVAKEGLSRRERLSRRSPQILCVYACCSPCLLDLGRLWIIGWNSRNTDCSIA